MANLFASAAMAEGYARSRPAVHAWVLRQLPGTFRRALDIGCGSGISTAALAGLAQHRVGLEPAEPMLARAPKIAPGADFLVGQAEALPFADESFDLIAAAGSLNYCDLPPPPSAKSFASSPPTAASPSTTSLMVKSSKTPPASPPGTPPSNSATPPPKARHLSSPAESPSQ